MCQQHDSIDIIPLVQIQGFLQHFLADHLPCAPVSPVTKGKNTDLRRTSKTDLHIETRSSIVHKVRGLQLPGPTPFSSTLPIYNSDVWKLPKPSRSHPSSESSGPTDSYPCHTIPTYLLLSACHRSTDSGDHFTLRVLTSHSAYHCEGLAGLWKGGVEGVGGVRTDPNDHRYQVHKSGVLPPLLPPPLVTLTVTVGDTRVIDSPMGRLLGPAYSPDMTQPITTSSDTEVRGYTY